MPDDIKRAFAWDEIANWNIDRSVNPPTQVLGIMGKNSDGAYEYVSSENRRLMISGSFNVTATSAPLSADSSSVSAKQQDAGNLRISSIQGDAGLLRVSALGVSVSMSPLSADSSSISAKQQDAANLRVSGIIDSGSVSAKSSDAGTMRVSAINSVSSLSPDAALFRVSAVGTLTVSAHEVRQSDAASLRTSAIIDSGSVSAKQSDAGNLRISAVNVIISAFTDNAANFEVSALSLDAGTLRVSSIYPNFSYKNITATGGPQSVKTAAGFLHAMIINDGAAKTVKLYDSNAGTNNIFATMDAPAKGSYLFDVATSAGISVSCVSASNITFSYI